MNSPYSPRETFRRSCSPVGRGRVAARRVGDRGRQTEADNRARSILAYSALRSLLLQKFSARHLASAFTGVRRHSEALVPVCRRVELTVPIELAKNAG